MFVVRQTNKAVFISPDDGCADLNFKIIPTQVTPGMALGAAWHKGMETFQQARMYYGDNPIKLLSSSELVDRLYQIGIGAFQEKANKDYEAFAKRHAAVNDPSGGGGEDDAETETIRVDRDTFYSWFEGGENAAE